METEFKKMLRFAGLSMIIDENTSQKDLDTFMGTVRAIIRRKVQKARNCLKQLDKELMDMQNGNFLNRELKGSFFILEKL